MIFRKYDELFARLCNHNPTVMDEGDMYKKKLGYYNPD